MTKDIGAKLKRVQELQAKKRTIFDRQNAAVGGQDELIQKKNALSRKIDPE